MGKTANAYYENFIGQYPLHKTLRFSLIPQGKTQDYIDKLGFITDDEQRSEEYKELKQLIDTYHRSFIERTLNQVAKEIDWSDLIDKLKTYQNAADDARDAAKQDLIKAQDTYRKTIADAFKNQKEFEKLFKKELITEILPETSTDRDKQNLLARFAQFTSYFVGFHDNRRNMYSAEAKSTSIAHRIINENFALFINNCDAWNSLNQRYPGIDQEVQDSIGELGLEINISQFFAPQNYSLVLTQKGIDTYNMILGGGFTVQNERVAGLNNIANERWQKHISETKAAFPNEETPRFASKQILLKQLHRQILGEPGSIWAHVFDQYADDGDVVNSLAAVQDKLLIAHGEASIIDKAVDLFKEIKSFDPRSIKLRSTQYYNFSRICFEDGFALSDAVSKCIERNLAPVAGMTKSQIKAWGKTSYRSLYEIAAVLHAAHNDIEGNTILTNEQVWGILNITSIAEKLAELKAKVDSSVPKMNRSISGLKSEERKLMQKEDDVTSIKIFLDSMLDFQRNFQLFSLENDEDRQAEFYAYYDVMIDEWAIVPTIYDRVRNYVTQKPYSKEKIKLNFKNPSFLSGWDISKQNANYGSLLIRNGKYFLAILNPHDKIKFDSLHTVNVNETDSDEIYQKVDYKYFPGATKMIPKCSITRKAVKEHFRNSNEDFILDNKKFDHPLSIPYDIFTLNFDVENGELVEIKPKKYQVKYKRETNDEAGFTQALAKWISFCLDFLEAYKSTAVFDFSECRNKQYKQLDQFYNDVDRITYSLTLRPVAKRQIDELVENGQLFLFQIYNKDFAPGATGAKNLHTSYFESLFSDSNLANNIFKLDGDAEMFYRPASIENPFVHETGSFVVNRTYMTYENGEEQIESLPSSVHDELYRFANQEIEEQALSDEAKDYLIRGNIVIKEVTHPIMKNRRYTKPQYSLHVPMTLNFVSRGITPKENNSNILKCVKGDSSIRLIGIDRGERNLLYYSVIDQQGVIHEQGSLNIINGIDYHEKLDLREKERTAERKSWKSIKRIKDLKNGYLSAVIHEITELVLKHNAIIVMEDLNVGFKRTRTKFEKQIYQNFEKHLIDKLNYCALKPDCCEVTAPGGILKGYQLANKFKSFKELGKQTGAIFYVPPWKTSQIDPTTGFTNLFRSSDLKYRNSHAAKEFFGKFKHIQFNADEGYFEFVFSYDDFSTTCQSSKKEWIVCSLDTDIPYNDVTRERGRVKQVVNKMINVTQEIKLLLDEYGIDYESSRDIKEQIEGKEQAAFFKKLLFLFKLLVDIRHSATGNAGPSCDCIVSPIKNKNGYFFDSRKATDEMPQDGDANGAYNIALKGLQLFHEQVNESSDKPWTLNKLANPNERWLRFVQERAWKSS